jgi:hypothetical protein
VKFQFCADEEFDSLFDMPQSAHRACSRTSTRYFSEVFFESLLVRLGFRFKLSVD